MKEIILAGLSIICWLLVLIPEGYSKLYLRVCKAVFVIYILSLGVFAYIDEGEDTLRFIIERFAFLTVLTSAFIFFKALDEKSGKLKVYGWGICFSLCIVLFITVP